MSNLKRFFLFSCSLQARPVTKVLPNMQDPLVYVQREEDDDAVIGVDRKGSLCFRCNFARHDCRHVKLLNNILDADPIPDSLFEIVKR